MSALTTLRPLVPSAEAAEVSNQGGGLRISTAKGRPGVNRDSLDEQPGSEAFYSPSASHDASPASEPPPPCSPSLSTNPIHDHDTHAASLVIGPIRPLLQNQAEAYLIPVYKTVSTLLDGG